MKLFFLARGEPFLIATKPLRPKAFLAFWTAVVQPLMKLFFLARRDAFLLTILPYLFLIKSDLVKPPTVFSLVPRKTTDLAMRPLAILLTAFFFIAFMAFMAAMAFIAFIALAIVSEERVVSEGVQSLQILN